MNHRYRPTVSTWLKRLFRLLRLWQPPTRPALAPAGKGPISG